MQAIQSLLARDLNRQIEEVIQVNQTDEESVYQEITEYIVTDRICSQYRQVLQAIADAPAEPHEGVGIWISGFFGSGKSSFAKNLGYVLADRRVLGRRAAELFKQQIADPRVSQLIDFINARIPMEVIMFDVSKDLAVQTGNERLAEVMYRVLLRELDYAEDFDVAELEIELEGEGRLQEFVQRCQELFGLPWATVRKGARKISRASSILHHMDSQTFPQVDSWANAMGSRQTVITVSKLVERVFELGARRRPGKAIAFIIDEVGQYIARSDEKIEDLRAIVEQFGKESKNRLRARQAIAPVWVIVTSQEKLEEVVAAIDSRRVELARLQDRFRYRVDLSPADIQEVATRRVLSKKPEAYPLLSDMYQKSAGLLNAASRLERTGRRSDIGQEDFIQFYPYPPHFIELSIDIMSGIRMQPGAPKHLGGSNRTIIKQAYEMLVSERTNLAEAPVGRLVSLDMIFELVEGNLSTEKQKDISDIARRFQNDPEDRGWAVRVAKAVCLLEFIRDLPRTETNIAAVLVDEVGKPAPLDEVRSALKRLLDNQFVRLTDGGYKLQTAQEKHWDTERRSFLEPKPVDRNAIKREVFEEIFNDPKLHTYRYKNLRTLRVGLYVDGVRVGEEGDLPLFVQVAEAPEVLPAKIQEARDESRLEGHNYDLYWVMAFDREMDELVASLHASRQMIKKYDQLRAQNQITPAEMECLTDEKAEAARLQARLRDKMLEALQAGTGLFRGVARDGSTMGKTATEIFKSFFDAMMPDLYPKMEMGVRPLKGNEAEEILKAANLNGLPQVFYSGEGGLNLVVKQGGKFVPNLASEAAQEVLNYLAREHDYGNRVTGKQLEQHFQGVPYGWERDMLRLILAVLLRAGAVDVTYQGQKFTNYQDPRCRTPLTNNTAFRTASFAPRAPIDIKTLTRAAQAYENLTGEEVDVEVGAIAAALQKLAAGEWECLLPLEAQIKAHGMPGQDIVAEYRQSLDEILQANPDDCVRLLAGTGATLKQLRHRLRPIREAVDSGAASLFRQARMALNQMWPVLRAHEASEDLENRAAMVAETVSSEGFYAQTEEVAACTSGITSAYNEIYTRLHHQRAQGFLAAIEEIQGQPEWATLNAEVRASLLQPLTARACPVAELEQGSLVCSRCQATVAQMEADLAGLGNFKGQVLARLQELVRPARRVERVRLAGLIQAPLDSAEAVDEAIERVREHLHKLVAAGATVILE